MKIVKLVLIFSLGGVGLYFLYKFLFPDKVDGKQQSDIEDQLWTEKSCVPESSRTWPKWAEAASRQKDREQNVQKVAEKYFGSKESKNAAIAGFFKGIDVFPSLDAAKYYKEYMLAWIEHPMGGFSVLSVQVGELNCPKEFDESQIPSTDEIADQLKDLDLDLSQIPSAEEIRKKAEELLNINVVGV